MADPAFLPPDSVPKLGFRLRCCSTQVFLRSKICLDKPHLTNGAFLMQKARKSWEHYERLVARLIAQQAPSEYTVTANARVMGKVSGRKRQLDVLIDLRHDTDNSRRLIVDAKQRTRKIDVVQVEAFKGLMEDVGATHGYLVSPAGHTKAAVLRAQELITIRLLPLDHLEDFDPDSWPACQSERCKAGRIFWNGLQTVEMKIRIGNEPGDPVVGTAFDHIHGKCDRCSRFHVRCLASNTIFSLSNKDEIKGCCDPIMFWLSSIESDDDAQKSAELHAILQDKQVITMDRKSV